jgi:hypothetical protein
VLRSNVAGDRTSYKVRSDVNPYSRVIFVLVAKFGQPRWQWSAISKCKMLRLLASRIRTRVSTKSYPWFLMAFTRVESDSVLTIYSLRFIISVTAVLNWPLIFPSKKNWPLILDQREQFVLPLRKRRANVFSKSTFIHTIYIEHFCDSSWMYYLSWVWM